MEKAEESSSQKKMPDSTENEKRDGKQQTNRKTDPAKPTIRSRPKRNKKRPRSQVHSNDNLKINTTIKKLEMDGKPILDAAGCEQFIRVIHPYPYTFSSFAKQRWVGRTVLDVYVDEFGSYPKSYYEAAIRQGRILVSDNKVGLDYKIQGKDVLTHIVHRHEPGVAVHPAAASTSSDDGAGKAAFNLINVVDETDELIILDKPGTLPIHPCGGYHLNSMTSMLEGGAIAAVTEQPNNKYFNIHRLDRLTSGLVILAKSSEVAKRWSQCIRQRDCQKYYLARVRGKFPMNLEAVNSLQSGLPEDGEYPTGEAEESLAPIDAARRKNAHGYWIADASSSKLLRDVSLSGFANTTNTVDDWLEQLNHDDTNTDSGESAMFWLHLACPTRISKPKNGVCEAGAFQDLDDDVYLKTVKPAQTSFGVVAYDEASDSTLLLCRPATGRTHQIRLHCQYLGHPIANDPNYGGDIWYRNDVGKEACAKARLLLGNSSVDATKDERSKEGLADRSTADVPATMEEIDQVAGIVQKEGEPDEDFIKRTCVWCARIGGKDVVEHSMLEFLLRSQGIWLHALQYCIGVESDADEGNSKVRFRTELPSWARLR